ncbi:MAG: hypothetical protein KAV42_04205 [Candidatus Krumholzibacteria bacterium]|nr:hypothetical protein [Candidatus Krumholzibacteria bacterium]
MIARNRSIVALAVLLVLLSSCSGGSGGAVEVLEDPVYGFYLGEKSGDLFERVQYKTSWTRAENPRTSYRGEIYEFSRPADGSREISRLRLTFVDDMLMEVVAYMRSTNISKLNLLKHRIEEDYGVQPTSPDGTTEMAYKTYWFKVPGMSITLRRITKKPENELYIQYMHDEFHRRIK